MIVRDREVIADLARQCIEAWRRDLVDMQPRAAEPALDPEKREWLTEETASVQDLVAQFDQGKDPPFPDAPGLVVIHRLPRRAATPLEDATLAAYQMILMAEALGLGTCFTGFFDPQATISKEIHKVLTIPAKSESLMALTFGLRFGGGGW